MTLPLAGAAVILAENKARIVNTEDWFVFPRGTMARWWPVRHEDISVCISLLQDYTSVTNFNATTPSQTIVNPILDHKVPRTGTYRQVRCVLEPSDQSDTGWRLIQILRLVTAGAAFGFWSAQSTFTRVYDYEYLKRDSKVDAPENAPGANFRASNTLDLEDGTYNSSLIYMQAKAETWSVRRSERPDSQGNTDEVGYRNRTTIPAATANEKRSIWTQSFSENDLGRYDGSTVHEVRAALAFGPMTSARSETTDTYSYDYENQDAAVDVPDGSRGRASARRNREDDTWDTKLSVNVDSTTQIWWGSSDDETVFHYETTISSTTHDMYIYDKYTRSLTAAENWLQDEIKQAGATLIGSNAGHKTDIFGIGKGRLMARRVERLP